MTAMKDMFDGRENDLLLLLRLAYKKHGNFFHRVPETLSWIAPGDNLARYSPQSSTVNQNTLA